MFVQYQYFCQQQALYVGVLRGVVSVLLSTIHLICGNLQCIIDVLILIISRYVQTLQLCCQQQTCCAVQYQYNCQQQNFMCRPLLRIISTLLAAEFCSIGEGTRRECVCSFCVCHYLNFILSSQQTEVLFIKRIDDHK